MLNWEALQMLAKLSFHFSRFGKMHAGCGPSEQRILACIGSCLTCWLSAFDAGTCASAVPASMPHSTLLSCSGACGPGRHSTAGGICSKACYRLGASCCSCSCTSAVRCVQAVLGIPYAVAACICQGLCHGGMLAANRTGLLMSCLLYTHVCMGLQMIKALQRHVLSGEMPALLMWRLCTSSLQQQPAAVRPSFGGMLASILLQRAPRMRQQVCLDNDTGPGTPSSAQVNASSCSKSGCLGAVHLQLQLLLSAFTVFFCVYHPLQECFTLWRRLCQSQAAVRAVAHKKIAAVALRWRRQQLQQGLRFWRMYTACNTCERLRLQLPAFPQRCDAFDAWLWKHERQQQLQHRAAGMAGRLGLLRCFGESST